MDNGAVKGRFVDSTFVDTEYHEKHAHYIHSHKNVLELLYVLNGSGLYYVNKHEYVVNKGNMVICNAGITHGESPLRRNKMTTYCCVLDNIKIEGLPKNWLINEKHNPVLYFSGDEVGHIMQAIHGIFVRQDANKMELCNILANVILKLVFNRIADREHVTEWSRRKSGDFVDEIVDYLDKNYAEPLTLEVIAEKFYMSQSAFSRFFKQETGISPLQYLLCRRIGEAQSCLMNTELSVGEVGRLVGYYDSSHFSATFRKHTGLTPSQYRNNFLRK
jgi:AraC-like DNA-binding protein